MDHTTAPVDINYWRIRLKFGAAGGADLLELTQEGRLAAHKVALDLGAPAIEVLMTLAVAGYLAIEFRNGSRIHLTTFGRLCTPEATCPLIERGLMELVPSSNVGRGYRLTEKGKQAVTSAHREADRLLARVRAAYGNTSR
jgi:hypothetical protein